MESASSTAESVAPAIKTNGQLKKADKLRQVLSKHAEERHLIVLQDFPDPDALSSAWTYTLISQQYGIECVSAYAGTLSHQENIALVRLTGFPVQRWNLQLEQRDLKNFQGAVFLDNQGTTSQITRLVKQSKLPVIAVIDHHAPQDDLAPQFSDIRTACGATATIFVQYLQDGLLGLDATNADHLKVATALMHGLRSETNHLMQAKEEDFQAAAYLSRYYDPKLLEAILQTARSRRVMDVIERALKNRIVKNSFSVSGVGYLRYEDRDAIPQAADFLITEEDIHTAVVYGIVRTEDEREIVSGSLRTNKLTLDPDEFIKKTFGQDASGRFFGGGRMRAGGFEIPVGFLSGSSENTAFNQLKWEVFDSQIKQKLNRLITDDEEDT
ncbi:DHH family phosphoesterase [Gloeobacter kilaueensis]|uniref:Phosphoesterase RecJ domain-containing protein n=1 Tax=Gloeobacter kilaueensis (strain ATCC BAA-2537 / CCAP 1431/1 / ULC 316 / JS1) TaxID=1183438 RepID=U5QSM2_GLOK1|nr:bifunctional oligoribonuclease/PAP phosphatase NrnA [Gloeobacter kilaueensis]AGY60674.1 phosphoesterase RecJ domain-containing protein [Gloeobacter kilaueensis JS1]